MLHCEVDVLRVGDRDAGDDGGVIFAGSLLTPQTCMRMDRELVEWNTDFG